MIVRMSKYHTVALPIMALVLSSSAPVTRASGSGEFGRVLGKAEYKVSPESREQFLRNGWTTLDDVLTEDELVCCCYSSGSLASYCTDSGYPHHYV